MAGTVLITGGTGFIGSHLSKRLINLDFNVHVLTRRHQSKEGPPTFHLYDGTIDSLYGAFITSKPDGVIHLASHYVPQHTRQDIDSLIDANVKYGVQLAECMSDLGCSKLVTAGTSWQHFHVLDDAYSPVNLYAATKQALDDILIWYADARHMSIQSLHLADTYGPNDTRPKIFMALERSISTGECLVLSPGEQLLDPLYIDDAVEAIISALRVDTPGLNVYNTSPGNPITLKQLVELWCSLRQQTPILIWGGRPYRDREVMITWQGGTQLPGWRARTDLQTGLTQTIRV